MDFVSTRNNRCLKQRVEHGVFGYVKPDEDYYSSIINWLRSRHNWAIDKETIKFLPGVVKGVAFAIDVFTSPNDRIIIQPPVYPPFKSTTVGLNRQCVNNPLILENGQ